MLRRGGPSVRIWRARWTPPACANADRASMRRRLRRLHHDQVTQCNNRTVTCAGRFQALCELMGATRRSRSSEWPASERKQGAAAGTLSHQPGTMAEDWLWRHFYRNSRIRIWRSHACASRSNWRKRSSKCGTLT